MNQLAPGLRYVDLEYLGVPQVIATAVLGGRGNVALVDPGPAVALPMLEKQLAALGLGLDDVTALVLTHIHLDHAGATGTIVARRPDTTVFVHERGARHMIDPTKLLDSATRLYGNDMDRLWGEFLAVPAANVRALAGGESIEVGGRELAVAYTPGHASHHVSYFDAKSRIAFCGDTAGGRIGSARYVMPPTPPPDIDLDLWKASLAAIRSWQPERLFLTHFGPSDHPEAHLDELATRLDRVAGIARAALEEGRDDEAQADAFRRDMRAELGRHMAEADAQRYELAIPFDHCFYGLARYWRKRDALS
ncbi:MAG: MBL fold metallo-hydrolase [Acidobacteria bacterium]|nr:MBL fold metallo-hydrolase [Acidobacteriota bacterium]